MFIVCLQIRARLKEVYLTSDSAVIVASIQASIYNYVLLLYVLALLLIKFCIYHLLLNDCTVFGYVIREFCIHLQNCKGRITPLFANNSLNVHVGENHCAVA